MALVGAHTFPQLSYFLLWDGPIFDFSWEIKAISCFLPGLTFNTGIGQHVLKNPLIVNSIIDKVGVEEERERVIGLLILFLGISEHRKDAWHKIDAV